MTDVNDGNMRNFKQNIPEPLIKQIKQEMIEDSIAQEKSAYKTVKKVNTQPNKSRQRKSKKESRFSDNVGFL